MSETPSKLPDTAVQPPVVKTIPVDPYKWENIVAKPLVSQDFTKIKTKNPGLSYFWANRVAGDPSGARIHQLEAAGFRLATPTDCDVPGLKPVDNHWRYGDLMLLTIGKAEYLGALKYNQQVSTDRLKANVAANKAMKQESKGMTTKMFQSKKLSFYQPTEEERNALFNKAVQEVK